LIDNYEPDMIWYKKKRPHHSIEKGLLFFSLLSGLGVTLGALTTRQFGKPTTSTRQRSKADR
jgi:hypothetical protein